MSTKAPLLRDRLSTLGLDSNQVTQIIHRFDQITTNRSTAFGGDLWMTVASQVLHPSLPFEVHTAVRDVFFQPQSTLPPLWYPSNATIRHLNLARFIETLVQADDGRSVDTVDSCVREFERLLQVAYLDPEFYWRHIIDFMQLRFIVHPQQIICHASQEDDIVWFKGCRLNIAQMALDRIFQTPRSIIWADENAPNELCYMSGEQLRTLSMRIGASIAAVYPPGTAIAVFLPMTALSVAVYLGIILAGCVVVSIADSFAAPEVLTRLKISTTKLVFTQDIVRRAGKKHNLYSKVAQTGIVKSVVIPENAKTLQVPLLEADIAFDDFLKGSSNEEFTPITCDGYYPCNILFSSGTTGTPKAIPWTHLTPLKCGVDGMICQNIRSSSIVCWPTNLGWMMGPWLIFAAYLNKAPIALYQGSPTSHGFCKFVEKARVTMLGVIPSIVRTWKANKTTEGCDWSQIECFSSTGEASSYDEYHWLMAQAFYKPVIEYCGGTEIGGAYISGCMIHPQTPSGFSTPIVGSRVMYINDDIAQDITSSDAFEGELAVVPPMLGLSQSLLNGNNVEVYYQGMPRVGPHNYRLRRHGDAFAKIASTYFSRGRCDDTMNLGGIKVSCIELEYAVMRSVEIIKEAAAVSFTHNDGGPEELVLFLVLNGDGRPDTQTLKEVCTKAIKDQINPFFKRNVASDVDEQDNEKVAQIRTQE